MELNIKFDEQMMIETANRVLDEFEYNGKTIREWANALANPITNADRIRAMTDEELADFISGKARTFGEEYEGYMSALDWLKQEAVE